VAVAHFYGQFRPIAVIAIGFDDDKVISGALHFSEFHFVNSLS
jgi:hypothetical protein